MNTAFSGPQLDDVMEREEPAALIYDEEFAELLGEATRGRQRFVAWSDGEVGEGDPTHRGADRGGRRLRPRARPTSRAASSSSPPGRPGRRRAPSAASPTRSARWRRCSRASRCESASRTMIAAPLFHSWGFAHFVLGLPLELDLRAAAQVRPRGDAAGGRRSTSATALVVVPVMMQRILQLDEETLDKYDLPLAAGHRRQRLGAPGPAGEQWMDHFGDNLYNLYGSTEVAWATIATPEDLRAAPGTAGRPPRGTVVKIVDAEGEDELPQGETGRIFVGNEMAFEGYTGGGGKDELRGPALVRRRRPLRRGGPPVHRRPRRRDDRLRRRERVPARGRGPARRPRRGQGGRRDRRRRRGVRPAPEGVRRHHRRRGPRRGRGQEAT